MLTWSKAGRLLVAAAIAVLGGLALPASPASAAPPCSTATVTVTRKSGPVLYLDTGSSPALNSAYALYKITNTSGSGYADLWVTIGSFAGPSIGRASSESGQAHIGHLGAGASANAAFYLTATAADASPEAHTVSVYATRPDLASAALCTASYSMTASADIAASANKVTSVSSSTPQLGGRLVVTVVGNTGTIGAAGLFTATPASYASWPADQYRLAGSTITMTGGTNGTFIDTLYFSGLSSSASDYTAQFTFDVVGTSTTATTVSPMTHISSGTQVKHTTTNNFGSLSAIPAVVNATTLAVSSSPNSLPPGGGTITYTTTITNGGTAPVTLDDVTATLPSGTTYVPGSATFGGTSTADPTITGNTAVFLAGLTIPANTSDTLTFQVTVPGTPGNYTVSVEGHVASATIDTTTGTGSQPATGTITVASPPPTVTAVTPANGPAAGGTAITVTGTNFTGATAVLVGTSPATSVTVVSDTTITATTPAGSGAVDVTVTTAAGTSSTGSADVFTYAAPPVPAPSPPNLTSTGVGTAAQTATITIPTSGSTTLLDSGGNPTAGPVTVTGQGSYALSGATITFTPVLGFAGTATPVGYRVTDLYQQTGDAHYTPTVTAPAAPTPPALTSTGVGTAAQTATITIPTGGSATLLDSGGSPTAGPVAITGQGTYALSGTTITFTPVLGFAGTATSVGYRVTDAYGQTGDSTYTPTVTAPAGPSPAALTSTGVGTAAQTATITIPTSGSATLLDSGGSPTAGPVTITGQGSYALSGTTITFTPVFGYAGTATPVGYRLTDAYGQTGDATYTPTVTAPAGPTPAALTSTGVGTAAQTVTITIPTGGSATLLDSGGSPTAGPVTITGQGSYALSGTTITFTPIFGYAGAATPVGYRITDAYGQTGDATYTPTVTNPAGPTPAALTSTGVGTATQTVTITIPAGGSATLLDVGGNPTAGPVTVTGQGSYTRSGATITFTPVLGYVGTATPVGYRVTDAYGQTGDATYTPTVTNPAGPTPAALTSTGVGTATQTVTITIPAGGSATLLDSGGNPTSGPVTIAGQGTYAHTGTTITFTPVFGFAGTPTPVGYRITDAYGQHGDASVQPTVTAPAAPTAVPLTSTGVGVAVQTVTATVPAGGTLALLDLAAPVQNLTVAGKGAFQAGATGFTFTPVLGFTGVVAVVYQVSDAYGQSAVTTYTAIVTAPPPPTAADRTTTGVGDSPQRAVLPVPHGGTVTLIDAGGHPTTTLTIAGQGTYTLDPATGRLTFTPTAGFAGVPTPVTYRVTDAYGQIATAKYRPEVQVRSESPGKSLPVTGPATILLTELGLITVLIGAVLIRLNPSRDARRGPM